MIINGFGGSSIGAGNASNDGWIDIINVPYSGTKTISGISHFSSTKTKIFASTELAVVWPYVGDYSALRLKPNSLTLKNVANYGGSSNYPASYRWGFTASDTSLSSDQTGSSTDSRTWLYAWLSGLTTNLAVGANLATSGTDQYQITSFTEKQYSTYIANRTSEPWYIHAPTFYDKYKGGSGHYITGNTYYFYIFEVWSQGNSSELSFSYSGGLVIQAHY